MWTVATRRSPRRRPHHRWSRWTTERTSRPTRSTASCNPFTVTAERLRGHALPDDLGIGDHVWVRLLRRLWRHRRYVASLVAVVLLSSALLVGAYTGPLVRFSELLVNLGASFLRSEEHTSELQSLRHLV